MRIERARNLLAVLFLLAACGKPAAPPSTATPTKEPDRVTSVASATAPDTVTPDAPTDAELDLSGYDKDVLEHVLYGRARARMFEDVSGDKAWSVDLALSELKIGDQTHTVQILGTWSNESNTFLWAWANEGKGEWGKSTEMADALHKRAALPGQAVFSQRKVAKAWVDPIELAYVAGELAGGYPVFLAEHAKGYALLLVTDAKIDVTGLPVVYVPGVILDTSPHIMGDRRACVRRFAARLGYELREEGNKLFASRANNSFEVELDDVGRITSVNVDAAPDPKP